MFDSLRYLLLLVTLINTSLALKSFDPPQYALKNLPIEITYDLQRIMPCINDIQNKAWDGIKTSRFPQILLATEDDVRNAKKYNTYTEYNDKYGLYKPEKLKVIDDYFYFQCTGSVEKTVGNDEKYVKEWSDLVRDPSPKKSYETLYSGINPTPYSITWICTANSDWFYYNSEKPMMVRVLKFFNIYDPFYTAQKINDFVYLFGHDCLERQQGPSYHNLPNLFVTAWWLQHFNTKEHREGFPKAPATFKFGNRTEDNSPTRVTVTFAMQLNDQNIKQWFWFVVSWPLICVILILLVVKIYKSCLKDCLRNCCKNKKPSYSTWLDEDDVVGDSKIDKVGVVEKTTELC